MPPCGKLTVARSVASERRNSRRRFAAARAAVQTRRRSFVLHLPSAVVKRFAQFSNVAFGAVAVRRKTRARAAILTRTSHSYGRNERALIQCTRHRLLLRHLANIAHDFVVEVPQSAVHLFPVTVPKPHLTGRPERYQGLRHVQATNVAPNCTKRSESHFANEKKIRTNLWDTCRWDFDRRSSRTRGLS